MSMAVDEESPDKIIILTFVAPSQMSMAVDEESQDKRVILTFVAPSQTKMRVNKRVEATSYLESIAINSHWLADSCDYRLANTNQYQLDNFYWLISIYSNIFFFRLKASGLPVKFCTNESQCTCKNLVEKLNKIGFSLTLNEIYAPAPLAMLYLKEHKLRPHLLVHTEALDDYSNIETSEPNCVVVADAAKEFNYDNMNKAFRVLLNSENPILLALGVG